MDRFDQLRILTAIVEGGSLSEAARKLNITPSAVSKQLSQLEDRLGVRLFNRTTRTLSLTDEGGVFYERARAILSDLAEAEESLASQSNAPRGRLVVDAPVAFGRYCVAPVLGEYLRANPEVHLDLRLNDRLIDPIEEGVDLVIRIGQMKDSALIGRRLSKSRRIVVASPDYIKRKGRPKTPEELKDHACLLHSLRRPQSEWQFMKEGGGVESLTLAGSFESVDIEVIRVLALDGLGLAQLPVWLVARDLENGALEEVLSDHLSPDPDIFTLYPSARHLSPKVRSLVDFLVERFGGERAWWATKL
jgi:DNA-binding transcriptional LysR family regulator